MIEQGPAIAWLDETDASAHGLLGGKCASLAEMVQSGFGVPPAFAVTTVAFWEFMESSGLLERSQAARAGLDLDDLASVEETSAAIVAEFERVELTPELAAEIRAGYEELSRRAGVADVPVAVRSSGVAEDLEGASFAGQYDTYLWVTGADAVAEHVKRCWAGLFGPEVLTYHPAGIGADGLGIAVAVQQMVRPRAAGVMLTLDPVTGDRSKIVVEANWGLGESVVSGDVTPDRYRMDKVTQEPVGEEIADKALECRYDEGEGVGMRPVPEERRSIACLERDDLVELVRLARKIEAQRGAPQDIEWAIDEERRVHILQVRPETVWSRREAAPVAAPAKNAVDFVLRQFIGGGA